MLLPAVITPVWPLGNLRPHAAGVQLSFRNDISPSVWPICLWQPGAVGFCYGPPRLVIPSGAR